MAAKRLSSMFHLSKDSTSQATADQQQELPPASPQTSTGSRSKLRKERLTSQSDLALDSIAPPPVFRETASGISSTPASRAASRDGRSFAEAQDYPSSRESSRSRPQTPNLLMPSGGAWSPAPVSPISPGKLSKKRSSVQPRTEKTRFDQETEGTPQKAWIAGLKEHIPYDLKPLIAGEAIPELWDEQGDVFVHLYPQSACRGPSFKVNSDLFRDSRTLEYLCTPNLDSSIQGLSFNDSDLFGPPLGAASSDHRRDPSIPRIERPAQELKVVHLPLDLVVDLTQPGAVIQGDDLELVVLYRNFFAFLGGGALISTPRQVSLFSIFLGISSILKRLQYGNKDGSTWGNVPLSSFSRYCEELCLADIRTSREKTIEAIVLGEAMRSWQLYNEGFVHAAGRLADVKSINSPKFAKLSPITVNRLERASLDVENRLATLRDKLEDFEFAAIFAGIANSKVANEAKLVRFKAWKLAFIDMKKFTLAQYRRRYGAWPPKASSKKNKFEESGLNRLLVREMYQDFCDLYDMLANKRDMTTRTVDMQSMSDDPSSTAINETIQHALRVVESEYDRATPPVIPPIPFDTPLLPTFGQSFRGGNTLEPAGNTTKLRPNELNEILLGSYNRENIRPTSWVQEFMVFERKLGAGATLDQLVDYRCGQWLFLYAVLQALPMTVVDARGLQYTEGVEYFLFAAPRGGAPWMREDTSVSRAWYNVSSGGQVLSLPADVLDHQPEGVYRRSHCWLIANQWLQESGQLPPQGTLPNQEPLLPPPSILDSSKGNTSQRATSPQPSPAQSPALRPMTPSETYRKSMLPQSSNHSNLHVALEQVQAPSKPIRPSSTYNPNITFDSILGDPSPPPPPKSAKKKKK